MEEAEVKSNVENLQLYSDTYPFSLALKINNFQSEADYKRFIRNCEAGVRRCIEYKLWRGYIIDVLQINECMITHESISDVSIDVHHHVPSLFIMISAIVNRNLEDNVKFCTFDICQEIMDLHFQNKLGYVTLLKSMHEKFHNGKLDIPIGFVKGDYRYFMKNYSRYLDDQDLETMESRMVVDESNCSWSKDNYSTAVGE